LIGIELFEGIPNPRIFPCVVEDMLGVVGEESLGDISLH